MCSKKEKGASQIERQARQAEALRENLKRRKSQARIRAQTAPSDNSPDDTLNDATDQ